jgi:hypothetical protein
MTRHVLYSLGREHADLQRAALASYLSPYISMAARLLTSSAVIDINVAPNSALPGSSAHGELDAICAGQAGRRPGYGAVCDGPGAAAITAASCLRGA